MMKPHMLVKYLATDSVCSYHLMLVSAVQQVICYMLLLHTVYRDFKAYVQCKLSPTGQIRFEAIKQIVSVIFNYLS